MLPVHWRLKALDELDGVLDYVARSDESAAEALRATFERAALLVSEHPYPGRTGRREGMREFVAHPNYIIVYRILGDRIEVVSVLHARRKYP